MLALERNDNRPDPTARLLRAVRVLVLGLLALHLAAPTLPEALAWGIWPAVYLSPAVRLAAALAIGLLCLPALGRRAATCLLTQLDRLSLLARGRHNRLFVLIALLAMPFFWTFRLAHTRWGDTYLLIHALAFPDAAQRLVYSWQAPLTVLWHARVWALGNRLWGWSDGMPAYALTSVAAGALFIFAVLSLSREALPQRAGRFLLAGLLLSLGTLQLFFGYVENYSLAALAVTWYLWFAVRYLHGRAPLWAVALVLALANGLHPSTIYLAPSLLVLGWVEARRRRLSAALVSIAWPMLVTAGAIMLLMTAGGHGLGALVSSDRPGGGDGRWLVPLFTVSTRWEHYTLFSTGHLVDIVNEQLLTAPLSLAVIALVFWVAGPAAWRAVAGQAARAHRSQTHVLILFLAVAAGGALLFITLWNADYGGQRDWDLFSLAAIPVTLLAGLLLARALRSDAARAEVAVLLIGVSLFHTAAWVFQNTLPWYWPA